MPTIRHPHASRGWPHRLEVIARGAGGVALVAMAPAVTLAWLAGSGALWVVAVCAAVVAVNETVGAWRQHSAHAVGQDRLEAADIIVRGDELASIANLLRWRLAAPIGAAVVFGLVSMLAVLMALR